MRFLKPILIINILFFMTVFLSGCNGNEMDFKDEDSRITAEVNEVISNFIVQKYSSAYTASEKQFEVHKVYGTNEMNGLLSVYMWSYYGCFNKSTGTEEQGGHSLPALIQLKKDGGRYSVIKYIEPEDGNSYPSSLKKMFPVKYFILAQQDTGNSKDLQKEMDKKVKQWLAE